MKGVPSYAPAKQGIQKRVKKLARRTRAEI